jgi:hypothetical protein
MLSHLGTLIPSGGGHIINDIEGAAIRKIAGSVDKVGTLAKNIFRPRQIIGSAIRSLQDRSGHMRAQGAHL